MIRVATTKLAIASVTAGTASAVEFAQATNTLTVDASQFIALALSGAIMLTAVLIMSAWKDLKHRFEELNADYNKIRDHIHDLQTFRHRMQWACPLADPSNTPERQREHLRKHLDRLEGEA